MKPTIESVLLEKIKFDEALYPRKSHDPALVQKYSGCLEEIESRGNYISVATDMTLLDGRHRHLAYLKNKNGDDSKIPVFVYPVSSESDRFALSVELNSSHGDQLSHDDKKSCVLRLYSQYSYDLEKIAKLASVRKQTALEWTKAIREEQERKQNEQIWDMWMACYTQEEIAEAVLGDSKKHTTVDVKIGELSKKFPGTKLAKLSKYGEDDWTPELYDIWNFAKKTNEVKHYGNTEVRIVDNLLYTFTEPFDIVVDPFGGGGSTIDICKKRMRRYWVSDRLPPVERIDIRTHDVVTDGISGPPRWADVALVYLDPPYWCQSKGKYSKDKTDLANMPLEEFTETLIGIIHGYAAKLKSGAHLACIISPTQWPNEDKHVDYHDIDLACVVGKRLNLVRRVICPYSSEQYNGTQVNIAKEKKLWMVLSRTMLVWQKA